MPGDKINKESLSAFRHAYMSQIGAFCAKHRIPPQKAITLFMLGAVFHGIDSAVSQQGQEYDVNNIEAWSDVIPRFGGSRPDDTAAEIEDFLKRTLAEMGKNRGR